MNRRHKAGHAVLILLLTGYVSCGGDCSDGNGSGEVDLVASSVSFVSDPVFIGRLNPVDVVISNDGSSAAPEFKYTVKILPGQRTVYTGSVPSLPAGGNYSGEVSASLPDDLEEETYTLLLEVDPEDEVGEADEGNNSVESESPVLAVPGSRNRAVVVGVSDYLDPLVMDLVYCDDDANAFASALSAADEWDVADVDVLTNFQATKANIESAIQAAGAELAAGDVFVFYFSGHGTWDFDTSPFDEADGWDECILPYDFDDVFWLNDIRDDELEQWLDDNYIPAGVRICVIIDACNSGGMGKGISGPSSLAEGLADDFTQAKGTMGAKDIDLISSLVGLFASADTEESWEFDPPIGHGIFTYYVLEALNTPSADADENGWFSAEEVFNYAAPLAYDWTYTYCFPEVQNPQLVDNYTGELDFRSVP